MRNVLVRCGVALCMGVFMLMTAAAQDTPAALDASSPASEPPSPASSLPPYRDPWQLGMGYQYQHFNNVLGQTFHDHGFNADFTHYFKNWLGLEGTAAIGFGNTGAPSNFMANSIFIGGGPHIAAYSASRFEPWLHVLVGVEHFRFTQGPVLGNNSGLGFMAGGGVDYKLYRMLFWRIQGDFIGSRFGGATQANYSFGSGLVLNF